MTSNLTKTSKINIMQVLCSPGVVNYENNKYNDNKGSFFSTISVIMTFINQYTKIYIPL